MILKLEFVNTARHRIITLERVLSDCDISKGVTDTVQIYIIKPTREQLRTVSQNLYDGVKENGEK